MIRRWFLGDDPDWYLEWPLSRRLQAERVTEQYLGGVIVRHAERDHRKFWARVDERERRKRFRVVRRTTSPLDRSTGSF